MSLFHFPRKRHQKDAEEDDDKTIHFSDRKEGLRPPSIRTFYNPKGTVFRMFLMLMIFTVAGLIGYIVATETIRDVFKSFLTVVSETLPGTDPTLAFPSVLDENLVDFLAVDNHPVYKEPMIEISPYVRQSAQVPFFWSYTDTSEMMHTILPLCFDIMSAGSGKDINQELLSDEVSA